MAVSWRCGWAGGKECNANLRQNPDAPLELYDLQADLGETTDVAAQQPDVAEQIRQIMLDARVPPLVEDFRFGRYRVLRQSDSAVECYPRLCYVGARSVNRLGCQTLAIGPRRRWVSQAATDGRGRTHGGGGRAEKRASRTLGGESAFSPWVDRT